MGKQLTKALFQSLGSIKFGVFLITLFTAALVTRSSAYAVGSVKVVSTSSQLVSALSSVVPGDTILLQNGTYSGATFAVTNKQGTASNPITIRATNQNQAIISGSSYFNVTDSSYITFEGMNFTNTGTNSIRLSRSSYVRIAKNTFHQIENTADSNWIYITGSILGNNTIERNLFENKKSSGRFILIAGDTATGTSRNNMIAYNHFRNTGPYTGNGMEAITVGSAAISTTFGGNRVEYNLFENCNGDAEVISLKSNNNIVRFNTLRNNQGAIVGRQANSSEIYGNFILGGRGGVRIYGKDNKIFNNYIEGTTGTGPYAPITIGNGDVETLPTGSNAYYSRPENATVAFNTLVNNTYHIEIGSTSTGTLEPRNLTFANNIVVGTQNKLVNIFTQPLTTLWEGNIMYATGSATIGMTASSSAIRAINPLLTTINSLQKLSSSSPAINTSSGNYASFLNKDMDGQDRVGVADVGADEVSSQTITRKPLTASMVGPTSQ